MKSSLVKSVIVGLSVMVLVGVCSGAAFAKDICLQDNFGTFFIFTKVKLKNGSTAALTGQRIVGALGITNQLPLSGSVTMNSAGTTITAGIFIHGLVTGNDITVNWTGEPGTLAGTGFIDDNGDYVSDVPVTLDSVSCSTIVIP